MDGDIDTFIEAKLRSEVRVKGAKDDENCSMQFTTYVVMRGSDPVSQATPIVRDLPDVVEKVDENAATDPFDASEGDTAFDDWTKKMNMTNPAQRDMCISYWYLSIGRVVDILETQTGHKFKPVAKVSAGPVEILEEQAAFMKEFLAETRRLESEEIEAQQPR